MTSARHVAAQCARSERACRQNGGRGTSGVCQESFLATASLSTLISLAASFSHSSGRGTAVLRRAMLVTRSACQRAERSCRCKHESPCIVKRKRTHAASYPMSRSTWASVAGLAVFLTWAYGPGLPVSVQELEVSCTAPKRRRISLHQCRVDAGGIHTAASGSMRGQLWNRR